MEASTSVRRTWSSCFAARLTAWRTNFAGLTAILDALADEVNRAAEREVLVVERAERDGLTSVGINLLKKLTPEPKLHVSVSRADDVLIIAMGEGLLHDVAQLLSGEGEKAPLVDDPRYRKALAALPTPEDSLFFFNLGGLLGPMQSFFEHGGRRDRGAGGRVSQTLA